MKTLFRSALLMMALPCSAGWAQSSPAAPPAQSTPAATPSSTTPQAAHPVDDLPDTPSATEKLLPSPEPNGPTIVFDTTMGRLVCQTFEKQSPLAVANFIALAQGTKEFTDPSTGSRMTKPFYDGTTFHRVIPHFMIQGGDRLGTGGGDPGFYFADEFDRGLRFDRAGRLAMANSGPNTNGSQFFITEDPVDQLDGKHTIFGQCDAHSILIVQSIARVERTADDKPTTPVVINKVTIVREGQAMPAEPATTPAVPATPAAH